MNSQESLSEFLTIERHTFLEQIATFRGIEADNAEEVGVFGEALNDDDDDTSCLTKNQLMGLFDEIDDQSIGSVARIEVRHLIEKKAAEAGDRNAHQLVELLRSADTIIMSREDFASCVDEYLA